MSATPLRTVGLALTLLVPSSLTAQASLYGVLGIGLPGDVSSMRTRALGGGLAMFDAGSGKNPATAALHGRLTVSASATTSFRRFSTAETTVGGLQQTRFLHAMVGSQVGRTPVSFTLSFGPYADRTVDITSSDTIMLRGSPVGVEDRLVVDGGISDVRGALGLRLGRRLQLGGAIHFLTGSTRLKSIRVFSDSAFIALRDSSQAAFAGTGVSIGANYAITSRVGVAVAVRSDTRLRRTVDSLETARLDLPVSVSGGIAVAPLRALRWSTTVTWRSWSDTKIEGTTSFNTWELGSGVEIGGPDIGASRLPLRAGVRYAQLPFSPTGEQPREWVVTGGSAYPFASNRALVEATLERIMRDGGGASERIWQLSIGLSLVP